MAMLLQDLLSQYVGQLVDGCGSPDCHENLCDTGKRNNADRPVRRWTQRSARAIALTIVSGPTPRKHLCNHYRAANTTPEAREHTTDASPDEKLDPSSFQQLFCDTPTVRKICTPQAPRIELEPTGLEPHVRAVDSLLKPVSPAGGNMLSNKTAASILNAALQACLARAPIGSPQQYVFANRFISAGYAYPPDNRQTPADRAFNIWLRVLDHIEIEKPASRLLVQVVQAVAFRAQVEDEIYNLKHHLNESNRETSTPLEGSSTMGSPMPLPDEVDPLACRLRSCCLDQSIMRQLPSLLAKLGESSLLCLITWLKKLFLTNWDGLPNIRKDSIAFAALFLTDAIRNYMDGSFAAMEDYFLIPNVNKRLSCFEIARSWTELRNQCGTEDVSHKPFDSGSFAIDGDQGSSLADGIILRHLPGAYHLLQFDSLFTTSQRAECFRTMNWRRMLKATSTSAKASINRGRADSSTLRELEPEGRLKFDEEQILVLKVRRDHVLQDAYDQLWQRRNEELFRPLRVWMAEADELELGQDLGGVQIEFFNLVVRHALAEHTGMFVTSEATRTSYFKPCSIQPLHQFELLGLLMALAVYNGVTLPISMHETFYRVLLSGNNITRAGIWWPIFSSDWPVEARSLMYILEQPIPDTDNSFSLEANGLRMSAAYACKSNRATHTMNVFEAVPMHASSSSIDVSQLSWPGWKLTQTSADAPLVVDWKKYKADYMLWMAYHSVVPQWEAFFKGFYRIMDKHTLSIFNPAEFKLHIEGTTKLDLRALRRVTKCEGYVPNEPYIQAFWRVLSTWSEEEQMGLVKFVTAAERIPAGGESELTFVIQQVPGNDDNRLPTSSTCFGILSLPAYSSADILNTKLTMAVKYGMEGFGVA